MKWIKSYTKFRYNKINEEIIFTEFTFKAIIETQFTKALESLSIDCKPEDVINWAKKTIFSTKSDSFILRLPIEELRASGGKGGSFLKPNYYNQPWRKTDEIAYSDCEDRTYYTMMERIFSKGGGLFADPNEAFDDKIECGLLYVKKVFANKFKSNPMPYEVIKYMMKSIRSSVAKDIKLPDKNIISFGANFSKGGPRLMEDDFHSLGHINNKKWKTNTEWEGFFIDETPTAIIPELKKLLISCGGRGLFKPEMINVHIKNGPRGPAEKYEFLPAWKAVYEPIIKKKRTAFYNWFTTKVYGHFDASVEKIGTDTVTKYLQQIKIDSSGKVKFEVGDKVVYLRKDKTIEEWNKLSDSDKENLDKKPASEIIGRGEVTKVQDKDIKIEYKPGEFVTKTSDQLIKKIEVETEEKEEKIEK